MRLIRPSAPGDQGDVLAKLGDTIAGARVIGKLGAGGMGAVLLGRDDRRQRNVALKIVGDQQRGERKDALLAEAKALTLFSHPNVVQLFGVETHQGKPVLVMEYVPGKTVEEYLLARRSPAPLTLTLSVLVQAATGLAAVHERGLVHADVKASNVLIGPAGRVCIADFGLVTPVTAFVPGPVARVAGTPEYLAPERATGALHPTLAPRMDVYSLGVMAFEMLTFRRLFATDSPLAQIEAHRNAPTPRLRTFRPDLSAELEAVLLHALEKDPVARTPSCTAFRSELLAAAELTLPPRSGAGVRVLLVSHDEGLLATLSALVDTGLAPVKVTRATSGEQARQALEAEADTDMVLLDLDLPDTSAVSLSAWMRASLPRPPRLMALVAEDGHPDWQMLQALGVSGFALKPPAADVLLFSMRRVLADAQRERDAEAVS
ncbi:MAG: protein kinase [Sandaracinaceae bacterium]|nr:protein kinase [Sandaracinaceae bacterium]